MNLRLFFRVPILNPPLSRCHSRIHVLNDDKVQKDIDMYILRFSIKMTKYIFEYMFRGIASEVLNLTV